MDDSIQQLSPKPITVEDADKAIDQFLLELKTDQEWEKANFNDNVTVWRKMDGDSGLYRIKMIGHLPVALNVVDKVLFEHHIRLSWDTILDTIIPIEEIETGTHLLHITAKSPPGVAWRDFVHLRRTRQVPKDQSKIVLDLSTISDKVPEREGYVRANTIFSGAILSPDLVPNMQTKTLDEGTKYSMISQVDIKGYIPQSLVNWALSYTTIEWFDALSKACEACAKGELK